jgi:hypothetical protein
VQRNFALKKTAKKQTAKKRLGGKKLLVRAAQDAGDERGQTAPVA